MNATTSKTSSLPYIATAAYYLSFIILGLTTAASGPSLLKLAEHTTSSLGSHQSHFCTQFVGISDRLLSWRACL